MSAGYAIERALFEQRLGQQAQPVRHAIGVVEVRALVIGVEDVQVIEADGAERVDVGGGHFAWAQRQLLDVPRERRVGRFELVVGAPIQGPKQRLAALTL